MRELSPAGAVPEWTLTDRLRKAREHAGLNQSQLAAEIGIHRASAVNYESGKTRPSRPVLLSWALRTGVSYEWLMNGDVFPGQDSINFRRISCRLSDLRRLTASPVAALCRASTYPAPEPVLLRGASA